MLADDASRPKSQTSAKGTHTEEQLKESQELRSEELGSGEPLKEPLVLQKSLWCDRALTELRLQVDMKNQHILDFSSSLHFTK